MKRGRKPNCPHCHAVGQNIAKGYRRTVTLGLRPLRLCKGCNRRFTVDRAVTAPAEPLEVAAELTPTVETAAELPVEPG
jgi:hypothetical protein